MSFWFLLAALMGPRFFARLLFFGLRMGLFLSCFLRSVATLPRENPQRRASSYLNDYKPSNYNVIRHAPVQVFTSALSAREFGQRCT